MMNQAPFHGVAEQQYILGELRNAGIEKLSLIFMPCPDIHYPPTRLQIEAEKTETDLLSPIRVHQLHAQHTVTGTIVRKGIPVNGIRQRWEGPGQIIETPIEYSTGQSCFAKEVSGFF